MIVVMKIGHRPEQRDAVVARIRELGLREREIVGVERTVLAVLGQVYPELRDELVRMDGVDDVVRISKPYKLASRETHPEDTVVDLPYGLRVGGGETVVIAGPCSIESEEQLFESARAVRRSGAHILRGGAFKPRSSPYSFRGLGREGLQLLAQAGAELSMPVITELLSERDVEAVAEYADVLQIGARNAQNFSLLDEVGQVGKPVMLKRGLSGTIEEWLLGAEYILAQGNAELILCERGIRTFEVATRNTLDLNAVALVKRLSHLPVLADPSHATGKWYLVEPMTLAALAAGADGVMVEVHPNPDHALSDGAQSLTPENFDALMQRAGGVAEAVGRPLHPLAAAAPR